MLSCQFRVPEFFAASGLSQCGSILVRTSRMRRSIPAQDGNESLGPVEQRQPVCDDLQPALVCSVRDTNVKVANCNVDGDAAAGFSADTGSCTFRGRSTATHPHSRTLLGGGQGENLTTLMFSVANDPSEAQRERLTSSFSTGNEYPRLYL